MILDGVDVFVEVVDAQSFSRAAKRLNMPPATVSTKIARLEQRLGITLIRRTTRRLHVTEEGRRYYAGCVAAIAALRNAEGALAATRLSPAGVLRLTVSVDIAQSLVPPLIERYVDAYPDVQVELVVTDRVLDLVAEGIDVAIRVGHLVDASLIVRKFRSARLGLWASASYLDQFGVPENPAQLAGHRFVVCNKMPAEITLRSSEDSFVVKPKGRIVSDAMENARGFVLRGNGIGVLPDFLNQRSIDDRPLVRVLPNYTSEAGTIYLAYPAQQFVPSRVRAFIALAAGEPLESAQFAS